MLLPSGYHLKEVTARLQWMGQMGWEEATRSAERELPLSTAQGQGPGTRDQRPGIRDHGKVSRWGNISTRLPGRDRPEAFRSGRCG